jgi:hypothetical protein
MTAKLFESALGISDPWFVASLEFDESAKTLTVRIDFKAGTRFGVAGHEGTHPVHDTVTKTYRHLNFFQHECHLQVRTPRVKLPNGSVRLVEPDFAGRLNGFTLLFEAFILMLSGQMPFAAVSRIVGESAHRVLAVCEKYVEIACALAEHSQVTALAIDETSRARGHSYVTLAADADARRVLFVTEGRDAKTIKELASYLEVAWLPAREHHQDQHRHVARLHLGGRPTFAQRPHLEGVVAWAQTRQTNGFLEAINGLFQASKRRARGFTRLATIRTVIVLHTEQAQYRQPLCGKGFVQFDHVDLIHGETRQGQHFLRRRCRTDAHDARCHTGRGHADDAGTRRRPCLAAVASSASTSAQAPSLTPLALPAVTVPSGRTMGLSLASTSRLVARGCSSVSTTSASPFFCGMVTAQISRAK